MAATYDGPKKFIYVDGALSGEGSGGLIPMPTGSNYLSIGLRQASQISRYSGDIAKVVMYGRARTSAEIAATCQAQYRKYRGASCK